MDDLTKDERELLSSVESGEWRSVKDLDRETATLRTYADGTFKKDKRINIRLSSKDLDALQKRALQEGIPYQTLVASILHKYVSGRLREHSTSDSR
jgi:predicted DNA binding CopG/RHH family protein